MADSPRPASVVQPYRAAERNEGGAAHERARDGLDRCRGTAVVTGLLIAAIVAFVALAVAAHQVAYFAVDLALARTLQTARTPALDTAAFAVSWPGFPPQSDVMFGAVVLLLIACRRFVAAVLEAVAAGGSAALWFAIAPLVNRPRPSPDLIYVSNQIGAGSFPSGHVLNLTAGLGFAWFLAYTLLPRTWWRTVSLWLVAIFLVLLGLARMYSGQHWPSDVLGGYLLGAVWLGVSITAYHWADRIALNRNRS